MTPPVARATSHNLHTQTMRIRNAATALDAARALHRGALAGGDPALPGLYVADLLGADDRFGTLSGLVVQGDAISWRSLHALLRLARRGRLAHQREDRHPAGVTPLSCPLCSAAFALDVHLIDGLTRSTH